MSPWRRALLATSLAAAMGLPARSRAQASAGARSSVRRGRPLLFPRDHGAHLETRTEWWYVTGWLAAGSNSATPSHGFQITFFRSRVHAAAPGSAASAAPGSEGVQAAATAVPASAVQRATGRFAPRHLLFAHAAITDLAAGRHLHAQRIARWNGDPATGPDRALLDDADIQLARWQLARDPASPAGASRWTTRLRAEGFALEGTLTATQPLLLQGDAGFSRKGPEERQASHYYSLPQLDAQLVLETQGRRQALRGRAWLDQEWSDELLHPQAVGWDWIGINLLDGSALTAFRLRRADGSALWAGGSWRAGGQGALGTQGTQGTQGAQGAFAAQRKAGAAGSGATSFAPEEVVFEAGRRWRSPATNAQYPVQWQVRTPAGRYEVRSLLDAQELDSRGSTGAVYWEGLAELLDEQGRRVGLGYLEMTGYAAPIRLG